MDLEEQFWMFVKSFNPNQYEHLLERPMHVFLTFIGIVIIASLAIFTTLLIPITYGYIDTLPAKMAGIEQLELGADVQASTPVQLLERPSIMLDMEANETRNGEFTITKDALVYPKYVFFGTGSLHWSDMNDLKNQTPARDRMLGAIVIFLLPSIIFWFFLYSMLKALLIFGILILIGYTVPKLFKHHISGKTTAKLALLTLPSLIIMDFALYPIAPLFWWGLLITSTLFFIGIALLCELPDEHHRKRKE